MTREIAVSTENKPEGNATQEKLQEKFMLFQLMEKQLETLSQHKSMVEARMVEIDTTTSAVDEIKGLGKDNETLVPLGSGLYIKARLMGDTVLAELGASVMKEKGFNGAVAFLKGRRAELEKASNQIDDQISEISKSLNELGPELQAMASQIQGTQGA
jgi:prefoldin alpha subunit